MKIKTKITVLFTLLTATILLLFATVIYLSAKESREREFIDVLKKEAVTKANLFLGGQVPESVLQDIYRSNRQILNEVEVAIYTTRHRLLYHDAVEIDMVQETPEMLDSILEKGEINFYQDKWQVVGLRYVVKGESFLITGTAYDEYGFNKLSTLLRNVVLFFIVALVFIYFFGRYFSGRVFKPVVNMTEKAKIITASNFGTRLEVENNEDELSELAKTFNQMLDRLENSYISQKNFVLNISHELRTPLAAIITELEISKNKDRDIENYKQVIENTLQDSKKLVKLLNSLLDLAKASYDPSEIHFKPIRVDEILLDARQQVILSNLDYNIDIQFEDDFENDDQISVNGNEYLLKIAFVNLFENGCKFSEGKKSMVIFSLTKDKIVLKFIDEGIGISSEDLLNIFIPFYRGLNNSYTEGNGIGLSLTQKIIALHNGKMTVDSTPGSGSVFTVEFSQIAT